MSRRKNATPSAAAAALSDVPARITVPRLKARYTGTTDKLWYGLLAELESRGAVVRRGRSWWGRWSAVDAALVSSPTKHMKARK